MKADVSGRRPAPSGLAVRTFGRTLLLYLLPWWIALPLLAAIVHHFQSEAELARYELREFELLDTHGGALIEAMTRLNNDIRLMANVAAKLEHFQQVADAFEQLPAARGQADYGERLLGLSHALHPTEDRFFLDALAEDLRLQRQTHVVAADKAGAACDQQILHWSISLSQGGIPPLHVPAIDR